MARIDLHLHTTYSDGSFSPSEVVEQAHHAGVTALAITDHDNTDGIPEAIAASSMYGIEVVPGVEISSHYQERETHILGYFFNIDDATFQHHLSLLRESRQVRLPQMVAKLQNLGLSLSYEEVKTLAGSGSIGRPHLAQVLVEKGYVNSHQEAFDRYLAERASAYVKRELPQTRTVISWIREAGGVPVLAHP